MTPALHLLLLLLPACRSLTIIYVGIIWDTTSVDNTAVYEAELNAIAEYERGRSYSITPSHLHLESVDIDIVRDAVCSHMMEGVVAYMIVSCNTTHSIPIIQAELERIQLPHITAAVPCARGDSRTQKTNGQSIENDVGRLVADVARRSDWIRYYLIHDETYTSVASTILEAASIPVVIFSLSHNVTPGEMDAHLQRLHAQSSSPRHVVMICDVTSVNTILDTANDFDAVHDAHGAFVYGDDWLIIGMDDSWAPKVTSHVRDVDNVALITPISGGTDSNSTFRILHSGLSSLLSVVWQLVEQSAGHSLTTLNMAGNWSADEESTCYVTYNIPGLAAALTDINLTDASESPAIYEVSTAWRMSEGRHFSAVLAYTDDFSRVMSSAPIFPNKQFALNGRHWVVATNTWPPFVEENANSSSGYAGLCIALLAQLSVSLNFTYELVLPPDMGWGVVMPSGQWTGLVGMLQNRSVSLTAAPLGVTTERVEVIDYTNAFYSEYITVLVKMEDPELFRWRLYVSPFSWGVWVSLIVTCPLAGLTMWLFTKASPYYTTTSYFAHLDLSMVYAVSSALTQGGEYLPQSWSCRLVVGFWWMFCIVIIAIYTGNLIAFLTVSEDTLPFDTFEEMLNSPGYTYGTMGGTNFIAEFNTTTIEPYSQIWKQMLKFNESDPSILSPVYDVHVGKVFEGGYAYIGDKTSFEMVLSTSCLVDMINEDILPYSYAMALPKSSAYTKAFSDMINQLIESGIVSYWKQQWWPKQSFCARGLVTEAEPVTLHDVQGVYYALVVLLFLSCITAAVEIIIGRITSRQQKQNKDAPEMEPQHHNAANGEPAENRESLLGDTLGGNVHQTHGKFLVAPSENGHIRRRSVLSVAGLSLGFDLVDEDRWNSRTRLNPIYGHDMMEAELVDQDLTPMSFVCSMPDGTSPDHMITESKPR